MTSEEFELMQEQRELENETRLNTAELEIQKKKYADMLNGGMGKDMMSVLNGETLVTIPKRKMFVFKLKCFFKNLFEKI